MTIRQCAGLDPMHQDIRLCGWTKATKEEVAKADLEVWIKQVGWFGFDVARPHSDITAAVKITMVDGELKCLPIDAREFFQL